MQQLDTEGRKARVWTSITTATNYRKKKRKQIKAHLKESAAKESERGGGRAKQK